MTHSNNHENKVACLFGHHKWAEEMPYRCVGCDERNPNHSYSSWAITKTPETKTVKLRANMKVHVALSQLEFYGKAPARDLGNTRQERDFMAKLETFGFVTFKLAPSIEFRGHNRRLIKVYELTEVGRKALHLLRKAQQEYKWGSMTTVPVKINKERLFYFQCHRY